MGNLSTWQADARVPPEGLSCAPDDSQATVPHAPRAMMMRERVASIAHEANQLLATIIANADGSIVEAPGGVLCATHKESSGGVFQFTVPLITRPMSIQN
jgi:hypothetical protein